MLPVIFWYICYMIVKNLSILHRKWVYNVCSAFTRYMQADTHKLFQVYWPWEILHYCHAALLVFVLIIIVCPTVPSKHSDISVGDSGKVSTVPPNIGRTCFAPSRSGRLMSEKQFWALQKKVCGSQNFYWTLAQIFAQLLEALNW